MEADEVTDELHTTMDAEEHHSSKDPYAEDSQGSPITEMPLEPFISKTPLEPLTSETPLETSTSQTPLEPHTYETLLEPSISKASLEIFIPENPLETHISEVPEKHFTFHNSSPSRVSVSSSDALKEDLLTESYSSEASGTKRSSQISGFESFQKHSFSGPSAQVHLDTSAKEREEAGEDQERTDATNSTTHTAQPGHHLQPRLSGVLHPPLSSSQRLGLRV